ncbi:MAG: hypothetical protein M1514_01965, partial [Patescibacteria group bacterium]|nr:hypothetical protein [Patescibacteria group bacterium]
MSELISGSQKETEAKHLFFFHGSTDRNIEEFQPEKGQYQLRGEKPAVFATSFLEVAIAFMRTKVCPGVDQKIDNGKTWHVVISDKEKFLENDHGGAVYFLPPETFILNPQAKLVGDSEYISAQSVKPIKKVEYPSSLEAMLQIGINVYFVDRKIDKENT